MVGSVVDRVVANLLQNSENWLILDEVRPYNKHFVVFGPLCGNEGGVYPCVMCCWLMTDSECFAIRSAHTYIGAISFLSLL